MGKISDISMVSDDKNEPDRLLISSGKFSFFAPLGSESVSHRNILDILHVMLLLPSKYSQKCLLSAKK